MSHLTPRKWPQWSFRSKNHDQFQKYIETYLRCFSDDERIDVVIEMIKANTLTGVFKRSEKSAQTADLKNQAVDWINKISDTEKKSLENDKGKIILGIYSKPIRDKIDQLQGKAERQEQERIKLLESHSSAINIKDKDINKLTTTVSKLKNKLQKKNSPKNARALLYVSILLIMIGITTFALWTGKATPTTVNIEYNVGEIIAGILAGAGVATAGAGYAYKAIKEGESPAPNDAPNPETEQQ